MTIRASTPMFLMSRKIKSMGVKMVLLGEGSDEIFGGYPYFHKAPNKEEFHEETCQKIKALHLYDCLRANKSTSAWHILYRQKEQFSDGVGYSWIDGLKEHANQQSSIDAIPWFLLFFTLQTDRQVTDGMLLHANYVYPENTPTTKEAYLYRTIFEKHFSKNAARSTVPGGPSVACSTAKAVEWDAEWSKNPDPSGRASLGVHVAAYEAAADAKTAEPKNGTL
ncbi:hypothetical protein Ahy_A01g002889 isoform C [Arachis hypogaea]|uniref:Asparagine synthetase domain-containing protein n=1 Tax=Arachis hypogaea TaxID=3818 RepID=A0A445ERQ3_ARAHY|nr:hypothetical protein Ahy_A01g002889 isoform C [Arachis hypogaea]